MGLRSLGSVVQAMVAEERNEQSAIALARDWGALGRSVRRRALEAVAMHFTMEGVLSVASDKEVTADDWTAVTETRGSDRRAKLALPLRGREGFEDPLRGMWR